VRLGDRFDSEPLFGQFDLGRGIEFQNTQRIGVGFSSPWILVQDSNELFDRRATVAGDGFEVSSAGRYHPIAHDEQPVMLSARELFDHDMACLAVFDRPIVSLHHLVLLGQFDGDSALVIGVFGFDDDG
jgi:hypothetical protein